LVSGPGATFVIIIAVAKESSLALSEFVAIETAYAALQQLDPAARQRALHWLSDALSVAGALPKAPELIGAPAEITEPVALSELAPQTEPVPRSRPGRRARSATARGSAPARGSANGRRAAKSVAAGAGAVVETGGGERAYRRMPDAGDVLAAYQQVGSVSGLADYYGVPRHTVQGWARRLRREGFDIGRGA
jgi:hypothetical protein